MLTQIYQMQAAGHTLRYRLRSLDTLRFFRGDIQPCEGAQYDVAVSDELFAQGLRLMPDCPDGYVEGKLLISLTSQRLLPFGACLFHAVAFAWRDRAWLLTGHSGAGKTTQYRHWKVMYRPEVEMICGDMPVLAQEPDGSIRVYPSPWNGKERWSGQISAPLGGIIFLGQAGENAIEPATPERSARSVLRQFICVPDTEQEIRALAALSDRVVTDYPVWLLRNRGDEDSVRLTRRTLEAYLSERSGK